MPVVPSDLATQWSTDFETAFQMEYNQSIAVESARFNPLILDIPLGDHQGNTVQLDWLGAAPQMRRWTDEMQRQGLIKNSWSAKVEDFEASIDIELNALNDAKPDVYTPRIREMGQNAARLDYNLISALIRAGSAAGGECYDGQYFFDTDHSEGSSGSQSNKLTGSGADTLAHITTDYYAALAALMTFKDDKGVVMAPTDFRPVVWIPAIAAVIALFEQLQSGLLTGGGNTNVLANRFDLVKDPSLTDANDWYMFRNDSIMKPFLRVNRQAPQYRDNFLADTGRPFEERIGTARVWARRKLAYMNWQKAVQISNA